MDLHRSALVNIAASAASRAIDEVHFDMYCGQQELAKVKRQGDPRSWAKARAGSNSCSMSFTPMSTTPSDSYAGTKTPVIRPASASASASGKKQLSMTKAAIYARGKRQEKRDDINLIKAEAKKTEEQLDLAGKLSTKRKRKLEKIVKQAGNCDTTWEDIDSSKIRLAKFQRKLRKKKKLHALECKKIALHCDEW